MAGKATPAPSDRPRAGSGAGQHHGVLQAVQRPHQGTRVHGWDDHPRRDHRVRGPHLHVHHQNPARSPCCCKKAAGVAKGSGTRRIRTRSRQGDRKADHGHRQAEDAGHERQLRWRRQPRPFVARPAPWGWTIVRVAGPETHSSRQGRASCSALLRCPVFRSHQANSRCCPHAVSACAAILAGPASRVSSASVERLARPYLRQTLATSAAICSRYPRSANARSWNLTS